MYNYSDEIDYKCPYESLVDSDYCIFHLKDDNKNVDEFNSGINELLETEEDSIDFSGFYFSSYTANFSALFYVAAVHPHCRRPDTGIARKGHKHQYKKMNCWKT